MMIKNKNLILILSIFFMGVSSSFADTPGEELFPILGLDADARAAGMGGAYTSLATDADAVRYNPAGLAYTDQHMINFMHNRQFENVSHDYVGYASKQGWGANIQLLDFGDVPITTTSDIYGANLGDTSLRSLVVSLGYGHKTINSLSLGGNIKYLNEKILSESSNGLVFDIGLQYEPGFSDRLSLAGVIQNLGPKVRFQSKYEPLPTTIRIGGSYQFTLLKNQALVSQDIEISRSNDYHFDFGFEWRITKMVPLRIGYKSRNDAGIGLTFGLGWIHKPLSIDYAMVPFGDLGTSNRISIGWQWDHIRRNGSRSKKKKDILDEDRPKPVQFLDDFGEIKFRGE